MASNTNQTIKVSGDLNELLQTIQQQMSMGHQQFSRLLHISPGMWTHIRARTTGPGVYFLRGVMLAFPEDALDLNERIRNQLVRQEVLRYLENVVRLPRKQRPGQKEKRVVYILRKDGDGHVTRVEAVGRL